MYIKDGEASDYGVPFAKGFSWGWLGNKVEEGQQGWESLAAKMKLITKLQDVPQKYRCSCTRGWHNCEICGEPLGNAEIKISHNGKIFICPSAVVHYVVAHDYRPPIEAINAVHEGQWLSDEDLMPDWEWSMKASEEDFQKARQEKLSSVLQRGMRENRRF